MTGRMFLRRTHFFCVCLMSNATLPRHVHGLFLFLTHPQFLPVSEGPGHLSIESHTLHQASCRYMKKEKDVSFFSTESCDFRETHCESASRRRTSLILATAAIGGFGFTTFGALALTPDQASQLYDKDAVRYDSLDGGPIATSLGLDDARRLLIGSSWVHGDVLEIGVGTGLNIDKYQVDNEIKSLTFVDISEGMLREAQVKAKRIFDNGSTKVSFIRADATSELKALFGEQSFDTVIDTFSLCVFGDEGAVESLQQMRLVVKPESDGGRVLLLENSRANNPFVGVFQDLTADLAASVGGRGCVSNQDVRRLIEKAGLSIDKEFLYAGGLFRGFICYK